MERRLRNDGEAMRERVRSVERPNERQQERLYRLFMRFSVT
jgi:hypothetical protein